MNMASGLVVAIVVVLVALRNWWVSGRSLRHDGVILTAILLYFSVGTVSLAVVPAGWSPRYVVNPRVWNVVAFGVVAYLIGAIVGRRIRVRPLADEPARERTLMRAASTLMATGFVGLVALTIASRAPLITGAEREGASGYLTAWALLTVPGVLLRFAARTAAWTRRDYALLAASAMGLLLTEYRTYALLLGLAVAVLGFLATKSRRRRWGIVLGGGMLAVLLGAIFGYVRFVRQADEASARLVQLVLGSSDPTLWRMAVSYVFFGFFREGPAILGFIVDRHPAIVPFMHGRALLGTLTSPLPGTQLDARAILSREVYGTRQTSLVSSIFGPFYLDFGMLGVMAGMAMLGLLLSWLELRSDRPGDAAARAAYAYAFVVVLLGVHTGLSDFTFLVTIPAALIWASTRTAAPAHEA